MEGDSIFQGGEDIKIKEEKSCGVTDLDVYSANVND